MLVTICIGSSCHLKGSRDVIASLERLISLHDLSDEVELTGSFCMGECAKGVCVKVDDELFSVSPATVEQFFNEQILGRI
ncbi:MAG TPA: (2Fe-2S) ferredoxin domain-containing protein [Candidatus Scybalocola faecavium]|nr:(2Fe-2S) ferredoxin domain-containing protein [Candidatus Scybalocola faecavium]